MLQMTDLVDGKTRWNLSETHIIIPIVDNQVICTEKNPEVLSNTITLNSLDGNNEAVIRDPVGHTLVIGLNGNLFDQDNSSKPSSNIILIQNPDLKWQSAVDSKSPTSYTLSYLDEIKNNVVWTNESLRSTRKPKQGHYSNDKNVMENETGLTEWKACPADEVVINNTLNEKVSLSDESCVIEPMEYHGYETQNVSTVINECQPISQPTVLVSRMNIPTDENIEDKLPKTIITGGIMNIEEISNVPSSKWLKSELSDVLINEIQKIKPNIKLPSVTAVSATSEIKEDKNYNSAESLIKVTRLFRKAMYERTASSSEFLKVTSLPEQSLPLKKKAKVKKREGDSNFENKHQDFPGKEDISMISASFNSKSLSRSGAHKPLTKGKERTRRKMSSKGEGNRKICLVKSEDITKEETTNERMIHDPTSFQTVFEVVAYLKQERLINTFTSNFFNQGLQEMKVDVLQEMIERYMRGEAAEYSDQLQAFALIVLFKKPAAFNRLKLIFKAGWPPRSVIRKWRQKLNAETKKHLIHNLKI